METGSERTCEQCGEQNPSRARFCLGCGSALESETPGVVDLVDRLPQNSDFGGERRNVTVLFADLSGFTSYSEGSDVEDVRTIAQETAQRLGEIVERYDGTVDKIIGDCVMAVWGAPVAHEDDAERAVRAALDMQECVAENRERFAGLNLCVGLQSGEAMWAPVGPDGRYTVLGDTVNTAARLQGAAAKGEVLIGEPTYRAVAAAIGCEEVEPVKAKNKAEPVPAWRAVVVTGERRSHRPVIAPLVGRDAEFNRLREVWERARAEKRTYGVTVLGGAGIGKSRLVESVTDLIGEDAVVLSGRCLAYGDGITYWPVIEMIQQAAGIQHDDEREAVSAKLGTLLEGLGSTDLDELRTMAVALANLIGAPTTPRGTYSATSISRGELHWGLRRILELGAKDLPLVFIIEDLHWAEPTLLDLISSILDGAADASILGVMTARPEFANIGGDFLAAKPNRRTITLDALSNEDARVIVTAMSGDDTLPSRVVDDVLRAAGGNPLFLEEMAQMLRHAGGSPSGVDVPTGLQALLDSRLDQLSSDERRIVTHASVVGDTFWEGTIARLEGDAVDVRAPLEGLLARDIIRAHPSSTVSGQREYGFKSGLLREAAYGRLTKTERGELHERCGSWIAELPGGADEFAEIIAYHLEQACSVAADLVLARTSAPFIRASHALMRAADKAEAREGMQEAARFLGRAVALVATEFPESAIELELRRARLLDGIGRYEEAHTSMKDVADRASTLGRFDLRCRALISLANSEVLLGAVSDARAHAIEAEELAKDIQDPLLRVRVRWTRAQLLEYVDNDYLAAAEELRGAVALAEEVADAESTLTARMRLGALLFNMGELQQARLQIERAIELAHQQGSLRHEAWLSAMLGLLRFHCGPRTEADELYAHASEWMDRTNDRYMHVQTLAWRAAAAIAASDATTALVSLREAERLARTVGGPLAVMIDRYLAEALTVQGRSAEVREVADAAKQHSHAEDAVAQANALVAEAFAAYSGGDGATARHHFSQAIPILEASGDLVDLGDIRLSYARVLTAMFEVTAASDQLERARELFEKLGATATVMAIDEELAKLHDNEIGEQPSRPTSTSAG